LEIRHTAALTEMRELPKIKQKPLRSACTNLTGIILIKRKKWTVKLRYCYLDGFSL